MNKHAWSNKAYTVYMYAYHINIMCTEDTVGSTEGVDVGLEEGEEGLLASCTCRRYMGECFKLHY